MAGAQKIIPVAQAKKELLEIVKEMAEEEAWAEPRRARSDRFMRLPAADRSSGRLRR